MTELIITPEQQATMQRENITEYEIIGDLSDIEYNTNFIEFIRDGITHTITQDGEIVTD
jgi:hypothetical protein